MFLSFYIEIIANLWFSTYVLCILWGIFMQVPVVTIRNCGDILNALMTSRDARN